MATLRATLWTAEIEVDGHNAITALSLPRNVEQLPRAIPGEVRDNWAVVDVALEQLDTRARLDEIVAGDHRRVAELRSVPPRQQPKSELAAADHRGQNQLVRRQRLARRWQRHGCGRRQRRSVARALLLRAHGDE